MYITKSLRFQYIPVRMVMIKRTNGKKFWQDCGIRKIHQRIVKGFCNHSRNYLWFPLNLKNKPIIWPCSTASGYIPNGCCILPPRFSHVCVHCCIVPNSKRKSSLDVLQWVMKIWHIYTKECYVAIKRDYNYKSTGKWMELEHIIWSRWLSLRKTKMTCSFSYGILTFNVCTYVKKLKRVVRMGVDSETR